MDNSGASQGRFDPRSDMPDGVNRKASHLASEVRHGISKFVDGVKEKIPAHAVREVRETASQVSDQVRGYIEERGIRGLADDVTDVIRRYPMPALLCGVLIGILLARPRGD